MCGKKRERNKLLCRNPLPSSFFCPFHFLSFSFLARVARTLRLFCLIVSPKRMRDRVSRAISYHTTLSLDDDDDDDTTTGSNDERESTKSRERGESA